MPAVNAMVTEIEETLLVLSEAVVVLIRRRIEDCGNTVAGIGLLPAFCVP